MVIMGLHTMTLVIRITTAVIRITTGDGGFIPAGVGVGGGEAASIVEGSVASAVGLVVAVSAGDLVAGRPPLTRWREEWMEKAEEGIRGMKI